MIRQILTLCGLMAAALPTLAETAYPDLAYGPRERNVLDLHLPDAGSPGLVLYIHGGAWFRGDKNQVEDYDRLQTILDAGLAVATMNYTWSQQQTWPAQDEDIANAIAFLQENAGQFGYDMDRFAVWGQSSGAHLALWSGIMDTRDPALGIDAIVSWYAPSNLHDLWQDRIDDAVPGANEREPDPTPESQLLGVDALENEAAADAASPEVQARALTSPAGHPPVLLIHGTMDRRVSPLQSERMLEALQSVGIDGTLLTVEGGGHGGDGFDAMVAPSLQHILDHIGPDT